MRSKGSATEEEELVVGEGDELVVRDERINGYTPCLFRWQRRTVTNLSRQPRIEDSFNVRPQSEHTQIREDRVSSNRKT